MTTTDSDRATTTMPFRGVTRDRPTSPINPAVASLGQLRSGRARSGPTRTVDGRPTPQVEDVLRALPSHGWPAGWIGRRDRALLVLAELAGLRLEQIVSVAAGDVTITGGVATIRTHGGTTVLRGVDDDLLCGPCALARWVHALDLTVVYPDGRVIAAVIARAVPLRSDSPHLCHSNNAITAMTGKVPLLPPIDKWGHPVRAVLPPQLTRTADSRDVDYRQQVGSGADAVPTDPADTANRIRGLESRLEQLLERRTGN